MRLLLDTSYLYDLMEAPGKFLEFERRVLTARDTRFHVSAVSIWEMRLKHKCPLSLGRTQEPVPPGGRVVIRSPSTMIHRPLRRTT